MVVNIVMVVREGSSMEADEYMNRFSHATLLNLTEASKIYLLLIYIHELDTKYELYLFTSILLNVSHGRTVCVNNAQNVV